MDRYSIGYETCVFWYGEKTKYRYIGGGEWECIEGDDSPARYEQLLDMVGR